jgi:hypothetical protein
MKHVERPVPPLGTKIHSWTVIGQKIETGSDPRILCRCDCGEIRHVMFYQLVKNKTFRCICCTRRLMNPNYKHGEARKEQRSREYECWARINARCYNPSVREYSRYGGRGIRVCDRWRKSFSNFLADMGARPSIHHSIDRINNDGHYEPSNCRWATFREQQNNRRSNHRITWRGTTKTITEWTRYFGLTGRILYKRLWRHDWNAELVFADLRVEDGRH